MVLATQHKPPNSIHHKRRRGEHHRAGKHYAKTYWPYLPLLLVLGLGFAVNSLWTGGQRVLGYATDVSSSSLLEQTNVQRLKDHETPLTLNDQLTQAAQAKAADMAKRNYWAHVTPDGQQPWVFVQQAGYRYKAVGENLAYGFSSSSAAVNGWMNSAEHRANILNGAYSDVAFGIANAPDYQGQGSETIIVAMYGQPDLTAAGAHSANYQITDTKGASVPSSAIGSSASSSAAGYVLPAHTVSRLQAATTSASAWSGFGIAALAAVAVLILVFKHGRSWRRAFVHGETFVLKHHGLDILLLAVGVIGFILTRSAGNIH